MDFIALDVETANASLASICQVGIVTFRNGQVVDQWQTLVNPEDYFDSATAEIVNVVQHWTPTTKNNIDIPGIVLYSKTAMRNSIRRLVA